MTILHVITLYNKPDYFELAAASVRAQTRECIHLAQQDTHETQDLYPPAVYFNKVAKDLPTDAYICWLSDDDIMLPNFAKDLCGHLDTHPEIDAVYGTTEHCTFDMATGISTHIRTLPQDGFPIYNAANSPYCRIDGGQFVHRRSTLNKISYPWYSETHDACRHCDGRFAEKIAAACGIYPLVPMKQVAINRVTSKSGHVALIDNQLKVVDWTRQTNR